MNTNPISPDRGDARSDPAAGERAAAPPGAIDSPLATSGSVYAAPAQADKPDDEGLDPAYLAWRAVQIVALDADYRRWRDESHQTVFSDAFKQWRANLGR